MDLKIFLKKNTPIKIKAIILLSVGSIFFILAGYSLWNQYFADTLAQYAPPDTVFYAHFSLPKVNYSAALKNILGQVFSENGLAGLDTDLVKREAAIFGRKQNEKIVFSLVIRTDNSKKMKKFLDEKKVAYRFLDRSRVAISPNASLAVLVANRKNPLLSALRGRFAFFNSLKIYLAKDFFEAMKSDSLLAALSRSFGDQSGNVYLNCQSKKYGLKIFASSKSKNEKINAPFLPLADFDLALAWQNPAALAGRLADARQNAVFLNQFLSRPQDLGDLAALSPSQILFLAKKKQNQTGWFFGDYDFYLGFDFAGAPGQAQALLEQALKSLLAKKFPQEKAIYLSDGTRIVELRPNPDIFKPVASENGLMLSAPDQSVYFFYAISGQRAIIANNRDLSPGQAQIIGNYLKISADLLPHLSFGDYLKYFDYLYLRNSFMVLK